MYKTARIPLGLSLAFLAGLALVVTPSAFSSSNGDEGEMKGVIRISMNQAYATVQVNSDDFGGVTFEKNGKVCVVANLAENMFPVTISMKPSEDGYKELEVTYEWKKLRKTKKRVKGGWLVYKLLKTSVKFAKGKDAPKKPKHPKKPAKPDKKPKKPAKPDKDDDDL